MASRDSTRLSKVRNKLGGPEHSISPGPSDSRKKRPAETAVAGVFPLLDDETAWVVLSYLPPGCLGDRSKFALFSILVYSSSEDECLGPY